MQAYELTTGDLFIEASDPNYIWAFGLFDEEAQEVIARRILRKREIRWHYHPGANETMNPYATVRHIDIVPEQPM